MTLKKRLHEFWIWLDITPADYAQQFDTVFEEYMFPDWNALLDEAYQSVSRSDTAAINDILETLAIDNEEENLLDYIVDYARDSFLTSLISALPGCIQPNARWQGAEIILRRPSSERILVLQLLMRDEHPYVRKRASNAFISLRNTN